MPSPTLVPAPPVAPAPVAELVLLAHDVRGFDENLKQRMGKDFCASLDASVTNAGFAGSMVLTPRCSAATAPALALLYGDDNRYIMADGNARLERIQGLGYRWALVFPQPDEDDADGTTAALQAIVAAGPGLLDALRSKVRPGEKVAFGRVNPRLTTPEQLKLFVLGFDRARAKYDENLVASTVEELIAKAIDPKLVLTLTVQKSAAISKVLDAQKQRDREEKERAEAERQAALELEAAAKKDADREAAGDLGEADPAKDGEPAKDESPAAPALSPEAERLAAKKKLRQDAIKVPYGPFWFTIAGAEHFERTLGQVKTAATQPGREGRVLGMLDYALEQFGKDATRDITLEIAAEVARRCLDVLEEERRRKG